MFYYSHHVPLAGAFIIWRHAVQPNAMHNNNAYGYQVQPQPYLMMVKGSACCFSVAFSQKGILSTTFLGSSFPFFVLYIYIYLACNNTSQFIRQQVQQEAANSLSDIISVNLFFRKMFFLAWQKLNMYGSLPLANYACRKRHIQLAIAGSYTCTRSVPFYYLVNIYTV